MRGRHVSLVDTRGVADGDSTVELVPFTTCSEVRSSGESWITSTVSARNWGTGATGSSKNCGTGSETIRARSEMRSAHLHDHRRLHNSADELRQRDFHGLQQSLNLRNLSLHHHGHIDNLVDVKGLRNLDMLDHLVDKLSVRVYDRPFRRAHVRNGRVPAERAGAPHQFPPETGERVRQSLLRNAALAYRRSAWAPRRAPGEGVDQLSCDLRRCRVDGVLHDALGNALREVPHEGAGQPLDHPPQLLHLRSELEDVSIHLPITVLPHRRRRFHLFRWVPEEAATAPKVGTRRTPPAAGHANWAAGVALDKSHGWCHDDLSLSLSVSLSFHLSSNDDDNDHSAPCCATWNKVSLYLC